jgi:hypothetical protein
MNIHVQFGNVSKRFFSETTWTIETNLPRNDHWKALYTVSVLYADRKSKMATTVEHFPMGSNVNLCPAVVAILDFDWHKKPKLCRGPSNDHSWAVQNGGYGRT